MVGMVMVLVVVVSVVGMVVVVLVVVRWCRPEQISVFVCMCAHTH